MAAEDIGALSVTLSLNSESFSRGMASIERQMKANDAAFQASVAEAGKLGASLTGLGDKQQFLSAKLQNQETVLLKYKDRLTELNQKYADLAKVQQDFPKQIDAAKKAWQDSANALKAHEKAADQDADAMEALAAETARLKAEYYELRGQQDANNRAMDNTQAQIESTSVAYQRMREQVALTSRELDSSFGEALTAFGNKMQSVGQSIGSLGSTLTRGVTLPIVGALTMAVKGAVDFEDAFAGVRKTVDASEAQFEALSDEIIGMSNTMPFAATEIAAVGEAAGQLGVKADDIGKFSKTMLEIGQATNLGATEAATSLARFANIVNMPIDNVDRLGSTIVALGNNFAASEDEIVQMGMRLAAAGKQAGMSEADIMGIATALRAVGIEAEAGGTAFSKVMLDMDIAAAKGEKAMKGYADVAGMSAKEFRKLWGQDSAAAMVKFIEGLGRVEAQGGNLAVTLEKLGYTEVRTRDALMRAAGASHQVAESVTVANQAWRDNIALTEEVDKRNATMASQLKVLANKGSNALMQFGQAAMPSLQKAVNFVGQLVEKFAAMDDKAKESWLFKAGAAALAGPALKVVGSAVEGVGKLSSALGKVSKLLGGGLFGGAVVVGGIALATAAIGGFSYALGAADREMKALQDSIKSFDLNLDEKEVERVRAAIETGIEAQTIYATAKAEVDLDYKVVEKTTEDAFEDGKVTNKEAKGITKAMNKFVDDAIGDAQKHFDEKTADYVAHLRTFTVGTSTTALTGDAAFVTQIQDIITGMGEDLKKAAPMLTQKDIERITEIVLTTPAEDLEKALRDAGFDDAELVKTVTDTVKPAVGKVNNIFEELGIADEGTRAAMVQNIMTNMEELRTALTKLGVSDAETQSTIIDKLGAAFSDLTTAVKGIPDDKLSKLTADDLAGLVKKWMAGPTEWNAALAGLGITDETTKTTLADLMGQFATSLDGVVITPITAEQQGKLVGAWLDGPSAWNKALKNLKITDDLTRDSLKEIVGQYDTEISLVDGISGLTDEQKKGLLTAYFGGAETWNAKLAELDITDESTIASLGTALGDLGTKLSGVDLAGPNKEAIISAWSSQFADILTSAASTTVLSDETIAGMAAKLQEKVNGMTSQLDSYRDEYNALIAKMSQKGYSSTVEEITRLGELNELIKQLATDLKLLSDETFQRSQASETLVMAGRGTSEDFGRAAGLAQAQYQDKLAQIKADATAALTLANQAVAESDKALAAALTNYEVVKGTDLETAALLDLRAAEITQKEAIDKLKNLEIGEGLDIEKAKGDYAAKLSELFTAMAQVFPEEAAKLQAIVDQYNLMGQITNLFENGEEGADPKADIKTLLTPEVVAKFLDMPDLTQEQIDAMVDTGELNLNVMQTLKDKLLKGIETDTEGMEGNPMLEMLKGMFAEGTITAEDLGTIDLSAFSGALGTSIQALNIKAVGGALGADIAAGVGEGVTASEVLATGPVGTMAANAIDIARAELDSHSPSREFIEIGKSIPSGLGQGIADVRDLAIAPLRAILSEMTTVGGQMVDGLIAGIQSKTSALVDAMKNIAKEAMDAAKAELEVRSPSRKMKWIGRMAGAGFVEGVDEMAEDAEDAAARMAGAAIDGASGAEFGVNGAARGGKGNGGGVTFNLTIHSPKAVTLSEAARIFRAQTVRLGLR